MRSKGCRQTARAAPHRLGRGWGHRVCLGGVGRVTAAGAAAQLSEGLGTSFPSVSTQHKTWALHGGFKPDNLYKP